MTTDVDFYYDNGSGWNSGCAVWSDYHSAGGHFYPSVGDRPVFSEKGGDDFAHLTMTTVVTLTASSNQLLAFCGTDGDDGDMFTVSKMIALKIGGIN